MNLIGEMDSDELSEELRDIPQWMRPAFRNRRDALIEKWQDRARMQSKATQTGLDEDCSSPSVGEISCSVPKPTSSVTDSCYSSISPSKRDKEPKSPVMKRKLYPSPTIVESEWIDSNILSPQQSSTTVSVQIPANFQQQSTCLEASLTLLSPARSHSKPQTRTSSPQSIQMSPPETSISSHSFPTGWL